MFDAAVACELAGQPEVAVWRSEKLEDLLSATAAKLTPSRNARGFPHSNSTAGPQRDLRKLNIAENGFETGIGATAERANFSRNSRNEVEGQNSSRGTLKSCLPHLTYWIMERRKFIIGGVAGGVGLLEWARCLQDSGSRH